MNENHDTVARDDLLAALKAEILTGSDIADGAQDAPDGLAVVDAVLSPAARAVLGLLRGPADPAGPSARQAMIAGLDRGLRDSALDLAPLQVVLAEHRIAAGITREALAGQLGVPSGHVEAAEQGQTALTDQSPEATAAWIKAVGAPSDRAVDALRRTLRREHAARSLAPAAGHVQQPHAQDAEEYVAEVERLLEPNG